jgi:hypothetical protein
MKDGSTSSRPRTARSFDVMIGRMDRLISEFLIAAANKALDEADIQTLKHHAGDMIGAGHKVMILISEPIDK